MDSFEKIRTYTAAAPFFGLLHRYYAHGLTHIDPKDWHMVGEFSEEPFACKHAAVRAATGRIADAPRLDIERLEYDFDHLFVGPGKLPAPPYETIYRSRERVLMQYVTLDVRDAYRAYGLQVDALNAQPDDHASYELAFAGLTAGNAAKSRKAEETFEGFLTNHLGRWCADHAQVVRKHTKNEVCLGFADLLEATVDVCLNTCRAAQAKV